MLNPDLLAAFANVLPATSILTASEDTRPYECDGLTLFRELPGAVLLPDNESQVVEILKIACPTQRRAFGLMAYDGQKLVGGIIGKIFSNWMHLDLVWVEDKRTLVREPVDPDEFPARIRLGLKPEPARGRSGNLQADLFP